MFSGSSILKTPVVAFALWLAAVAVVFGALGIYGSNPGPSYPAPVHWPQDTQVERYANGSTLLVFLHPGCPCSRATLDNLKDVIADSSLSIVLISSEYASKVASDLASCRQQIRELERCDNTTHFHDIDSREAKWFHATTSGYCLLYDERGMIKFSGGITSSRGHQGANAGMACLKAALSSDSAHFSYPVFGCPLLVDPVDQPTRHRDSHDKNLLPACCRGDCRA